MKSKLGKIQNFKNGETMKIIYALFFLPMISMGSSDKEVKTAKSSQTFSYTFGGDSAIMQAKRIKKCTQKAH